LTQPSDAILFCAICGRRPRLQRRWSSSRPQRRPRGRHRGQSACLYARWPGRSARPIKRASETTISHTAFAFVRGLALRGQAAAVRTTTVARPAAPAPTSPPIRAADAPKIEEIILDSGDRMPWRRKRFRCGLLAAGVRRRHSGIADFSQRGFGYYVAGTVSSASLNL
jgi:hypothetical protein